MKLKLYLVKNKMTMLEFCKIVNVSYGYMSNIINGHVKPSERLAELIEIKTNGEIKPEDLTSS